MKLFLSIVMLLSAMWLSAQSDLKLESLLPVDPQVSKGVLDNGLTYYVRANSNPTNRAELMLVLKAGSVDEDDDQQGLAHFCEHMAFNGTKNYPKHELINYFESIGMEFGPEINAYTSFDETVYMLKVPLDTVEYMNKGLQVLYDWACQITDSDEEINNERGIIHEEWRGGRNAMFRMQQQWLPVYFNNSRYAHRLPIGKMEIVDNCPPEALRRFRHDWYRPDLQAVIVVGDFDQEQMVAKVKEMFSQIPKVENPREKKYYEIPDHKETLVKVVTDKEAQYPIIFSMYKHPLSIQKTVGDYRKSIIRQLYNGMINSRLAEKTQQADPPFLMGQTSYSSFIGPKDVYQSVAVAKNGHIEEAMKALFLENKRVRQYGFTETELERQKTAVLKAMEKAYNERENQKSINYANEYKRNFLMTQEPIPGIEKEYEYFKKFVPEIKLEEVNALCNQWMTDSNRVIVVMAPEVEGVKVPTEEEVLAVVDEVAKTEVEPYEDAVANVPLIEDEPFGSKVIETRPLEKVDAVEWKLENGATVVYKKTDFKDDEILFSAWSPGGNSVYNNEDAVSADLATDVLTESGIAKFDNITLKKMLTGKVFSLSPYIDDLREGFSGSASVNDLESMLQMLYLYFTEPRFDTTAYKSLMTRYKGILENKAADPMSHFRDTLTVTLANYHPRKRPLNLELLKEANFDRIKFIAKDRFKDASDYKFFFVGNIDEAKFKALVEKYIGGIPTLERNEKWRDLGIRKPQGVVEKVVKKGQDDKSIQYIVFHGDFDYTAQNKLQIDAMAKVLTTKLLEVIREDKSSVYSIGARASSSKYPVPEYSVSIYYGTDPAKLAELKQAVFEIIREYAQNGPTEEEVAKAREKLLREREVAVRENSFWLGILSNTYFLKDGDFSDFGTYEKLVNNITPESTQKAFKEYFNFDNYVSVALAPGE